MRWTEKLLYNLMSVAGYLVISLIGVSQRSRFVNVRTVRRVHAERGQAIIALWHNRLMMIPYVYRRLFGKKEAVTLVSTSKDGEYIARILKYFRPLVVRGSTTRGGSTALKTLVTKIEEGMDCVITPDGPQGPKYRVQLGTVALARITGVPVIPFGYWSSRRKILGTWDGFVVTLLFGKTTYVFGEPLYCPQEATDEQMAAFADNLREALFAVTQRAREESPKVSSPKGV